MKRIIALLMVVLIFAVTMTACSEGCQSETINTTENAGAVDATTSEDTSKTQTEAAEDNANETAGGNSAVENTGTTEEAEKILADNDDFSIVVTNCVTDASKGFVMYTEIENKTQNPLVFKVTASALNNKDMHPEFTYEVPAKEKVNLPMVWSAEKLDERNVIDVTEVKMELEVVSCGEEMKMISSEIYVVNP